MEQAAGGKKTVETPPNDVTVALPKRVGLWVPRSQAGESRGQRETGGQRTFPLSLRHRWPASGGGLPVIVGDGPTETASCHAGTRSRAVIVVDLGQNIGFSTWNGGPHQSTGGYSSRVAPVGSDASRKPTRRRNLVVGQAGRRAPRLRTACTDYSLER